MSDRATFTTISGAAISGVGAFTLSEWLALAGFILAVLGFIVNWYYRRKNYQLERRKVELQFNTKL